MTVKDYYYVNFGIENPISHLMWGIAICNKIKKPGDPITIFCKTKGYLDYGSALHYLFYPHINDLKKSPQISSMLGDFKFNFSSTFDRRIVSPVSLILDPDKTMMKKIELIRSETSLVIVNYHFSYEESSDLTKNIMKNHPLTIINSDSSSDYETAYKFLEFALNLQERTHIR